MGKRIATVEDLNALRKETVKKMAPRLPAKVTIQLSVSDRNCETTNLLTKALIDELAARGIGDVHIIKVADDGKIQTGWGCVLSVSQNGSSWTYRNICSDRIGRIVTQHIVGGEPVAEWLAEPPKQHTESGKEGVD